MHLLVLGDIHSNLDAIQSVLAAPAADRLDLVVVVGDLADLRLYGEDGIAFDAARALNAYQTETDLLCNAIARLGTPVVYVPGNHDLPTLRAFHPHCHNVDALFGHPPFTAVPGWTMIGVGGSPDAGQFPYEWHDWEKDKLTPVEQSIQSVSDWSQHGILLSHAPPKWCRQLDVGWMGNHWGSERVRDLLCRFPPRLVITGHIHESAGADIVDGVLVVNAGSVLQYEPVQVPRGSDETDAVFVPVYRYLDITLEPAPGPVLIDLCRLAVDSAAPPSALVPSAPSPTLPATRYRFEAGTLFISSGREWIEFETTGDREIKDAEGD